MSLTGAVRRWLRNKPSGSIKTWEDLKTKFLSKYCPPARTAKKMEEINNFQQEPDETLYQAWERFKELLMKCPQHYLMEMQEKVNEMVYVAQVRCEQCKGPHYTKDYPLKEEGKTLEEAYYTQFGTPFQQGGQYKAAAPGFYQINNANPSYQELRQSMEESLSKNQGDSIKTFEIKIGKISKVLQERGFGNPPSSTETNPRDYVKSISTTVEADMTRTRLKHPKGIAKNVLVGIGKFVFLVDFIILDMSEDVKVPLIRGRPFLSTTHTKIDVFKRTITLRVGDETIVFKSVKPASSLIKQVYMISLRERMELDLEARLMGETLVLNRSLDPLYVDYIKLNDLNVPLELRRDQVDDFMPIIEEVVENMDSYRDQDMGDAIFGEPLCKASCVEARRFDELITIHNGNDNVTYQMAQSHPRFKHPFNAQCNKIRPLLKVSVHDKQNSISHSYQKFKSFYKGVSNLGPEYIRDMKMEEWITCGHISVHEIE
ncbi:pyruvate dehydrogenase (acetyl-transferring) kinase, mitochondrial [Tanacetum coccineum]